MKVKSLKLSWLRRALINPTSSWKSINDELINECSFDMIIRGTGNNLQYIKNLPNFYIDIYHTWLSLNNFEPKTKTEILQEQIWLNQHITVDSKSILWKLWISKGVLNVNDLLDSEGNFLSLNDFNIKHNLQCSFIDHLRIRQALPQSWRNIIYTQKIKKVIENMTCNITFMDGKTKNFTYCKSNEIYSLIKNQQGINKKPTCIDRWHSQYEIAIELWPNIFFIPFRACRETYLQSFQYRLIHRIIPCNNWLYKLKVTDTNQCTYRYCSSNEIDDIKHFLVTCHPVLKFWDTFVTWWNRMNFKKLDPLTEVKIMLGFDCQKDEDLVLNFCLILAKYYIYTCKRNQMQIDFMGYLNKLKQKLTTEEAIHFKNSTSNIFYKIWGFLAEQI